jgi:putative zinc finger protein
MKHQEIRESIPAYAASRLDGEARREVADHLAACSECREIAESCAEIHSALKEWGEEMFDPHPDELAIRDFARGAAGERTEAIRRHLEGCMTCGLELEAWKGRKEVVPLRERPASPGGFFFSRPLLAAAGIVLGFGAAFILMRQETIQAPLPPHPSPAPPPATAPPSPTAWTGRAPQWILPGATRGQEPSVSLSAGKGETHLIVSFRPSLPEDLPDAENCRFEILRESGRSAWSTDLPAATLRADLERTEAISFVIPASVLEGGRYEFQASIPSRPGEPPFYRVAVQVNRTD